MVSTEDDILATAEAWRRSGLGVALATVVETWGSILGEVVAGLRKKPLRSQPEGKAA